MMAHVSDEKNSIKHAATYLCLARDDPLNQKVLLHAH